MSEVHGSLSALTACIALAGSLSLAACTEAPVSIRPNDPVTVIDKSSTPASKEWYYWNKNNWGWKNKDAEFTFILKQCGFGTAPNIDANGCLTTPLQVDQKVYSAHDIEDTTTVNELRQELGLKPA